jgi:MFS family permease
MSRFLKIYFFFLIFILAVSLGRGFLPLWFFQNGFSYSQIALFYLIDYLTPSVILIFAKNFSTVKSLTLALISEILLMLSVYRFFHPWQIYLSGVLAGATVVFFYLTYNTLYFENTPQNKRALSSSFFTLGGPLIGVVVPIMVGFFGQQWGLSSVFLIAALIHVLIIYLIKLLPKIEFKCRLKQNLGKTKSINFLLFLEGIKESVSLAAIPVFTLYFIRQPLPYGVYFSYLGFVSTAAAVFLGFLSDRFKKRAFILYPATIMVGLTIIALGLSKNLLSWAIISGVLGFATVINGTFVTTLVLDKTSKVNEGMISREFLLGIGRVIGVMIFLASLGLTNQPSLGLIFIGFLYLLFPFNVHLKKLYQKG